MHFKYNLEQGNKSNMEIILSLIQNGMRFTFAIH